MPNVLHSIVTRDGQTTLPAAVREALQVHEGDQLEYNLDGDRVTISLHVRHPGAASLAGSLASDEGKGMTFDQIRQAAAATATADAEYDQYR